jgi:peroxiredoxin
MLYAAVVLPLVLAFSGAPSSNLHASRVGAVQMSAPASVLDVPEGPVFFPPKKVNFAEYIAGRNVVLVGLPGAFTPT